MVLFLEFKLSSLAFYCLYLDGQVEETENISYADTDLVNTLCDPC